MWRALTILTYHRILPGPDAARYPFPSLAMPVEAFDQQVAWLAESCTVLPVGAAVASLREGPRSDRRLVSITFDDGYEDAYSTAAPILESHGVRATFFVTVQPIEERRLLWFDRAALLWRQVGPERLRRLVAQIDPGGLGGDPFPADLQGWIQFLRRARAERQVELLDELAGTTEPVPPGLAAAHRLMSVDEVVDLSRRGHEVASHTLSHPFLTDLAPLRLHEELSLSRARLSTWLGREADGFCYPAGDHDARTVQAVREAGYRYACTTEDGTNDAGADPYRLRRNDITVDRVTRGQLVHDILGFRMEVSGLRNRVRGLLARAP